jgi:hypothetical protein
VGGEGGGCHGHEVLGLDVIAVYPPVASPGPGNGRGQMYVKFSIPFSRDTNFPVKFCFRNHGKASQYGFLFLCSSPIPDVLKIILLYIHKKLHVLLSSVVYLLIIYTCYPLCISVLKFPFSYMPGEIIAVFIV